MSKLFLTNFLGNNYICIKIVINNAIICLEINLNVLRINIYCMSTFMILDFTIVFYNLIRHN
jgi:hypothetical protein